MKNLIPVLFFLVLLSACNNKADQPAIAEDTLAVTVPRYSWQASLNDSTGRLEMIKSLVEDGEISPKAVIEPINQQYPEIKLDYLVTSNDTVYIKIDDAHYLTQQMGSSGSTMYLASLVYNLTELPHINFVNIAFEEGDHAQPGTFTRETFADQ